MLLYHGSNMEVCDPQIRKSNRALDFGTAFYTTSDYEQAKKWAKLTYDRKKNGTALVNEYDFDEQGITSLKTVHFESANGDWLKFVAACRTEQQSTGDYDIVTGPVANDRTFDVINLYIIGAYDEEEAIRRLLPFKLKDQYAFRTEKALRLLTFRRRLYV